MTRAIYGVDRRGVMYAAVGVRHNAVIAAANAQRSLLDVIVYGA